MKDIDKISIPELAEFAQSMFEGLVPGSTEDQFYQYRFEMQFSQRFSKERLPEDQFVKSERKLTTRLLRQLPASEIDIRSRIQVYRQYLHARSLEISNTNSQEKKVIPISITPESKTIPEIPAVETPEIVIPGFKFGEKELKRSETDLSSIFDYLVSDKVELILGDRQDFIDVFQGRSVSNTIKWLPISKGSNDLHLAQIAKFLFLMLGNTLSNENQRRAAAIFQGKSGNFYHPTKLNFTNTTIGNDPNIENGLLELL